MFRLYDTWLRSVTDVVPARPGQLRISACGPPAGRLAHLGDLRAALLTDLIRRLSEVRGWLVLACQAIDDLPDRLTGDGPGGGHDAYLADRAALNIAPPDVAPRASESIGLLIAMIGRLIETGRAYPVPGGSVYADARRMAAGRAAAGRPQDNLAHGRPPAGSDQGGRRSEADWALWHGAPAGSGRTWPAPWGSGFPAPDALSPAMSLDCLGDRIDIQTGGPGLSDAQHEHEQAQFSAAAGHDVVRHWAYSETVLFEGRSATQSAGTTVLLADLASDGRDPLAVRLALLEHRYREPLDLTMAMLSEAEATVRRWRGQVADWADEPSRPICAEYWAPVTQALDDDLDTPTALRLLRSLAADREVPAGSKFETFAAADRVLALDLVSLVGRPR